MIHCYFNQHQNNAGGLAAAFTAASITGQGKQANAARLILSPFNKHLPFAGSFIKETKKAAETALKLVINNKPAAAGFSGLIWPKAGNGYSQASQQPASSPAASRRQAGTAMGTGTTARKSLKVAQSRSKSLKVAGSESRSQSRKVARQPKSLRKSQSRL